MELEEPLSAQYKVCFSRLFLGTPRKRRRLKLIFKPILNLKMREWWK